MPKSIILFILILAFASFSIAGMQKEKCQATGCGYEQGLGPGPGQREEMMGPHHGEYDFGSWMLPGKWWKRPEIQKELKLTDDQINKLEDMLLQHKKEMIDLKSNIAKKQLDLEALLDKENIDDKTIMQKEDELINLRGNLQRTYIKMILDMKKVLTPEQAKKLKELRLLARTRIHEKLQLHRPCENPPPPPED